MKRIEVKVLNKQEINQILGTSRKIKEQYTRLLQRIRRYISVHRLPCSHIEVEYYEDLEDGFKSIVFRLCMDADFETALRMWDMLAQELLRPEDTIFFIEVLEKEMCRGTSS